MRKIAKAEGGFWSHNTCQHRGRVLHFSQSGGDLVVTELVLGEGVESVRVETGRDCIARYDRLVACCRFGERVLVMAGGKDRVFAALVEVEGGRLDRDAVRVTKLAVAGNVEWDVHPFLCQVSEGRALLYFYRHRNLWYCDVAEGTLTIRGLRTVMPATEGFCTLPVRLPEGGLLVAGAYPYSRDITVVTCDEEPTFEKVGEVPGEGRGYTSSVLVGDRFVVGFGGMGKGVPDDLDELWVFDLRAGRSSVVWESGEWAASGGLPVLVLQGGTLYIVAANVCAIALQALAGLINEGEVRDAFCDALGFPRVPRHVLAPADPFPPDRVSQIRAPLSWSSRNTVLHNGRIIHFYASGKGLLVSELVLHGRYKNVLTARTGVECQGDVCCCPFEDGILVMGKGDVPLTAALVAVGEGPLGGETVDVTPLTVVGGEEWGEAPCLCRVSERQMLLYFNGKRSMWYCEAEGVKLRVRKIWGAMPTEGGFSCLPIRLPDGKLLVAGSDPESRDATLITCGEYPRFEKVGEIPEVPRREASLVLFGERFVLGFGGLESLGGRSGKPLNDLWVLDLQTRRASIVWRTDEWVEAAGSALLFLRDGCLWVVGRGVGVIPLRLVSERIDDEEVRGAFCGALRLPAAPPCSLPPPVATTSSEMERMRGAVSFEARDTVQHQGRIFHLSVREHELFVSEVIFYSRRTKLFTAGTGVHMRGSDVGCCSLGDKILAMTVQIRPGRSSGRHRAPRIVSAVLVGVDEGRLSEETVHATDLALEGKLYKSGSPILCQAAEDLALLYFSGESGMWHCQVSGETLSIWSLRAEGPMAGGFPTVPIRLPDGRLLLAGASEKSRDITAITCGEEPRGEKIGDIPGRAKSGSSSVLVGERFVVGFGGDAAATMDEYLDHLDDPFWLYFDRQSDDLWVFDLRTRRGSLVRRKGDWHPAGCWVFLAVQGPVLYLIGGTGLKCISCISLAALAGLIQEDKLRRSFSWHLGVGEPFRPAGCFRGKDARGYVPHSL